MSDLYGVAAFIVYRRCGERGRRPALGATRIQLLQMRLADRRAGVGGGVVAGSALAVTRGRVRRSMLYQLGVGDPFVLVVALALATSLACVAPAARASRVVPRSALDGV